MSEKEKTYLDYRYTKGTSWKNGKNIDYHTVEIVDVFCSKNHLRVLPISQNDSKYRKKFESLDFGEKWAASKIEAIRIERAKELEELNKLKEAQAQAKAAPPAVDNP